MKTLDVLHRVNQGFNVTMEELTQTDTRTVLIALLTLAVMIGSIIAFIMWFRRGYFNLHTKISTLKYSEGWAAGGWFVPILNLWRPVEIMSEMSNRTQELLEQYGLKGSRNNLKWIIPVWWSLWIITGAVNRMAMRGAFDQTPSVDELIKTTEWDMYASMVSILLSGVAVVMVMSYSKMEDELVHVKDLATGGSPRLSDNDLLDG